MSAPERYVPGASDRMRLEHETRYAFAAQFAAGRNVLDLGCGAGLGARACLEARARSAALMDADEAACALARENLKEFKRVEVRCGDVSKLPWRKPRFDLILFLELIEHLEEPGRVLARLAGLLRPEGVVVVSTPAVPDPENPHHIRCYEREADLRNELKPHFSHVRILGQHTLCGSAVTGTNSFPGADNPPSYWVALAGHQKLPSVKGTAHWEPLERYEAQTLRRLEADIEHLKREREGLKRELSAMRRSVRWRVTGTLARLLGFRG